MTRLLKNYGYAWVTLAFFLISLAGHWFFGWLSYVDEQSDLHAAVTSSGYIHEMMRDTLENWQSEFLQLLWQVGGLAVLLCVGSPSSKEGDDRMEAKLDAILMRIDPDAKHILKDIDERYQGRHTDPFYPG